MGVVEDGHRQGVPHRVQHVHRVGKIADDEAESGRVVAPIHSANEKRRELGRRSGRCRSTVHCRCAAGERQAELVYVQEFRRTQCKSSNLRVGVQEQGAAEIGKAQRERTASLEVIQGKGRQGEEGQQQLLQLQQGGPQSVAMSGQGERTRLLQVRQMGTHIEELLREKERRVNSQEEERKSHQSRYV